MRRKASSSFSERFISKKHSAKGKTRISSVFTRPLHVCTLCKQHTHRESHTLGTGSSFTGSVNSGLKLRSGNPSCHHLSRTEYFSPCIFSSPQNRTGMHSVISWSVFSPCSWGCRMPRCCYHPHKGHLPLHDLRVCFHLY